MAEERREMRFSVRRLVNPPPLVFSLEHATVVAGPNVSQAMAKGESGPGTFTLLLRLLMTHFDLVDTEEGYTKLHTLGICVTARVLLISVGRFAYLCRPLRGVSAICLRRRMLCWRWFG